MFLLRRLKMYLRTLVVSLKPSQQLFFVVLSIASVIWILVKLQRPLDAMPSVKIHIAHDDFRMKYAFTRPIETEIETVYTKGFLDYNTPRIPALVYNEGFFLAFCEARKESYRDIGTMDIVLRRGRRREWEVDWGKVIVVANKKGYRLMNPTPIVDEQIGIIVLVFIAVPAHLDQWTMVRMGMIQQKIMVTRSFDNGLTWTGPTDITASTIGTMEIQPGIYASGPGHGIQTSSGRLVVPGNYFVKDKFGALLNGIDNFHNNSNSANVMLSDDHGITWHLGGSVPFSFDRTWQAIHTTEPMAVELQDGVLVLNTRTLHPDLPRAQAVSINEGHTFSKAKLVPELVEPGYSISNNESVASKAAGCQASLIGFPAPSTSQSESSHNVWVAFSNPASPLYRERMSIRLSRDGCETWSRPWTIYRQPAAYSDIAYFETTDPGTGLKLQNFAVLFEGGKDNFPYEKIMFKMFNLDAVLSGVQRTDRQQQVGV